MAHFDAHQPDLPPGPPVSPAGASRPGDPPLSERARVVAEPPRAGRLFRRAGAWLLEPHIQVFLSVVLMAASQMLQKRGAVSAVAQSAIDLSQLRSGWVWLGIITIIGSLLCWLNALRRIQLSVAYNLSGLLHVLVPLGSWWLLGEKIGGRQWVGIVLVFLGVMITAPAVARTEAKEHA